MVKVICTANNRNIALLAPLLLLYIVFYKKKIACIYEKLGSTKLVTQRLQQITKYAQQFVCLRTVMGLNYIINTQ